MSTNATTPELTPISRQLVQEAASHSDPRTQCATTRKRIPRPPRHLHRRHLRRRRQPLTPNDPYQHGPRTVECVLSDCQASVLPGQHQRDRHRPRALTDTSATDAAVIIGRLAGDRVPHRLSAPSRQSDHRHSCTADLEILANTLPSSPPRVACPDRL